MKHDFNFMTSTGRDDEGKERIYQAHPYYSAIERGSTFPRDVIRVITKSGEAIEYIIVTYIDPVKIAGTVRSWMPNGNWNHYNKIIILQDIQSIKVVYGSDFD